MIRIGNAPVSYGAFEVTVGHDENVPTAEAVLDALARAGYGGIDLGPLGYLGTGDALRGALSARSLLLTGGYVEIDVSDDATPQRGMDELDAICDQFDVVARDVASPFLPRPTVAIIAPDAMPDTGGAGGTSVPDGTLWARAVAAVGNVAERCRARGYEPCLHNEVGTLLSNPASIDAILTASDASLCLDTGHLVAAGGDPCALLDTWKDRVDHIHLKDATMPPGTAAYTEAMTLWETGVFCRIGAGDARVDEFLDHLGAVGYAGWIVVEQDVLPTSAAAYAAAAEDQVRNLQYLRGRGW